MESFSFSTKHQTTAWMGAPYCIKNENFKQQQFEAYCKVFLLDRLFWILFASEMVFAARYEQKLRMEEKRDILWTKSKCLLLSLIQMNSSFSFNASSFQSSGAKRRQQGQPAKGKGRQPPTTRHLQAETNSNSEALNYFVSVCLLTGASEWWIKGNFSSESRSEKKSENCWLFAPSQARW